MEDIPKNKLPETLVKLVFEWAGKREADLAEVLADCLWENGFMDEADFLRKHKEAAYGFGFSVCEGCQKVRVEPGHPAAVVNKCFYCRFDSRPFSVASGTIFSPAI